MRTTVPIIAFLLLAVGLFTPQYAQADALFLTSLPYENASGWDFTSSSWSNKIVIKPEAFGSNLDPDKYTYSLQVKTDCGVQVGHAVWTGDTEDWKGEISGSGGNGEFTVSLGKSEVINIRDNKYCIQFNNSSGKLYYIRLVVTEREPVGPMDFSKSFHTEGTKIMDGNGNEFVMRGLNYSYAWQTGDTWRIKSAHDKGCNAIRLNIGNGQNFGNDGYLSYTSDDDLRGLLSDAKNNHIIAMPCPQNGTCADDPDIVAKAVDYWIGRKDIMNEYAAYAILNITNEWYRGGDEYDGWHSSTTKRPQSEIDAAAKVWSETYVEAVTRLREEGIKNLIVIDVAGCGQGAPVLNATYKDALGNDRYYAQDIIDADASANGTGKSNIAFSIHMYQISGRDPETVRRNINYCLNLNVPCVLGEFAFEHKVGKEAWSGGGPVAWVDIQEYSREKNVSWLAWSWTGNGGNAETCDLFDGNGNLQENGYCMFRGVQGIERTSTDCTIFSANPGGPGLAYRYPEGPFPHEIYTRPDGGHGQGSGSGDDDDPSDDPEPPTDFKEAIALDSQHWGIQKDDDTSWGRYYTIDSFALKHFLNICRYGKLHITLQASTNEAQCAAYYNNTSNDYDHNNHGSDHLIGDSHEGGKYYFSDFSGEKTWTIDLTKEQVINLSELGLRIDASFCRVTDIKWETPEPGVTFDEESFDLEKPVNHDMTRGDYHIVPTRFAELRDGYDLLFYVESQPAAKRQAKQSRAAGDADECQIYTLNDDKSKTYLDNIEYQPAYGSYRMTDITPEQIAKFQRNGLYVSGTGRFLSVEAASRNVATGVGEIHPATDSRAQIFTLTGVPVTDMTPGNVYIVVRNGKAWKMIR